MFEHLIEDHEPPVLANPRQGFAPLDSLDPQALLDGQIKTTDWLEEMGAPIDFADIQQRQDSRAAFVAVTTQQSPEEQKRALMQLRVPPAVRHIVAQLTAYDWAFVEQANELRGYTVSKIFDMTQHPDPRHALRALELMGKVTEVGLFTERVEITKIDLTDEALEAKIKSKLDKFRHVIDVTDVIENEPTVGNPTVEQKQRHAPDKPDA